MQLEDEVLFLIEAHRESILKATDPVAAESDFYGTVLKLRIEGNISVEAFDIVSTIYGYKAKKATGVPKASMSLPIDDDLKTLWEEVDEEARVQRLIGKHSKAKTPVKPSPTSHYNTSSGCGGSSSNVSSHC